MSFFALLVERILPQPSRQCHSGRASLRKNQSIFYLRRFYPKTYEQRNVCRLSQSPQARLGLTGGFLAGQALAKPPGEPLSIKNQSLLDLRRRTLSMSLLKRLRRSFKPSAIRAMRSMPMPQAATGT